MSGIIAVKLGLSEQYYLAGIFVLLGAIFDFFDGFVARLLGVQGEIGKQLDSLADMVTFGVAPGVVMYSFLKFYFVEPDGVQLFLPKTISVSRDASIIWVSFIAFLIPLLSAVRLAKFNIDENQSDKFIGLPTPANALFFVSIPFGLFVLENGYDNLRMAIEYQLNPFSFKSLGSELLYRISTSSKAGAEKLVFDFKWMFILLVIGFSLLLNAPIEMLALKFKSFGWKGNEIRYIFLLTAIVIIFATMFISSVVIAVPIIILLYIVISLLNNAFKKTKNEI